jgi:hypothetical protein
MPTRLAEYAVEGSTFAVELAFWDEDGESVSPDTLVWSLYDDEGDVVNERDSVEISDPGSTETVVLTGDDLRSPGYDKVFYRHLIIEATYTSTTFGSGLDLVDSCVIPVYKASNQVLIT